ncbi:uncharacterized protein [Clytia hemisphaerica]|uniref:Uncharacterized protein n=1 Tax=Clytia hemisphaerica TaxID=252671 RepID=A0A7M5V2E6_9CNID
MPFKMKDVVKMGLKGRTRSQGESLPLVVEQQQRSYSNSNNNHRKISGSQDFERHMSTSSSTTSLRPNSMSFDNLNVVKIRPGMPHGPPSPKMPVEKVEVDYENVPFQYYTRKAENNEITSLLKALALVLILFICPSILVFVVFLFTKYCKTSEQRKMTDQQKKEVNQKFVIVGVLTFITDLLITGVILHFYFGTDVPLYHVLYATILSLWLLAAFVGPSLWFYFASTKYEFGFNVNKFKGSKSFDDSFTSNKTKDSIARKLNEQQEQFKEDYQNLSSMETSDAEFLFVRKSSPRYVLICAIILGLVSSLVRTLIPLLIQLSNLTDLTGSINIDGMTIAVLAISTFNAFIVSLIAAPYFVYVILWKIGMLREWKRFNANERDTRKTLVNGGPQGIAMWWKIRQTLNHFSSSSKSLSVLITDVTISIATILIATLSVIVFKMMTSSSRQHDVIPFLLDNLFLYGAILVLASLSVLIKKEQKVSGDTIELKQLNLCYELGHLMNLEQDAMDVEPGVKVKVRVFRGCLMLLQELTIVLRKFEKHSLLSLHTICLVVSSICFLFSTGFCLWKFLME